PRPAGTEPSRETAMRRMPANCPPWKLAGDVCQAIRTRQELPLMVVAGQAARDGDVLVFHCRLQHHSLGKLVNHRPLDLLPRRLMLRIGIATLALEIDATALDLLVRHQDIGSSLAQVDADAV